MSDRLLAATRKGRFILQADGEGGWTLGKPHFVGEPVSMVLPNPRDSRHLTIGVSCGGVWQTADSAATWHLSAEGMEADYMPPERRGDPNVQDPHRVVQCTANPNVLWTQHHCAVFRSTDGATHWQRIEAQPSSFGFAVAVHPHEPDTAWFVPCNGVDHRRAMDVRRRRRTLAFDFIASAAGLLRSVWMRARCRACDGAVNATVA